MSAYDQCIPYQILKIIGKDRITEIPLGDYVELLMNVLFMDIVRRAGDLAPPERARQPLIQARFAPSR